MNFEEIKKDLKYNNGISKELSEVEANWSMYDSTIEEFGGTFLKAIPEEYTRNIDTKTYPELAEYGEAFKKYIEDTLSKSKDKKLSAIEFGGTGYNLFQGFKDGLFSNTAGVCLIDIRMPEDSTDDIANNHTVIEGDIFDLKNKKLDEKIAKALNKPKADLIISRTMGPLKEFKKNPMIMAWVIKKWYELLNENGLMFIQFEYFKEHNPGTLPKHNSEITPPPTRDSEKIALEWVNMIEQKYKDLIEVQLGRGILRLHKLKGAPEKLPILE